MPTMLREIRDRAACAAWSPLRSHADLVVLGTKDSGVAGFEDTGGELDIYNFGLDDLRVNSSNGASSASQGAECIGSIKTKARFSSVAWTAYDGSSKSGEKPKFPMGLIAGGMVDGVIHVWNPAAIIAGEEGRIYSFPTSSQGSITAMAFNPLERFNLAVGDTNGKSWTLDLSAPKPQLREPAPGQAQKSGITAVAWNSQVAHIVATAAADGTVMVWDLKSQKAWCELRAEVSSQAAVADIAWNPTQGLFLLTASAEQPIIKVWDLAASTSMPVKEISAAETASSYAGFLQLSWCPHDPTLLLSSSKDNRTLLWDLHTALPIADLPVEPSDTAAAHAAATPAAHGPAALFASNSTSTVATTTTSLRYQVVWSPWKRGIVLTSSLDRKVQAHSILSLATRSGRPPAWMKPPSTCIATAFGATFLTCPKDTRAVTVHTLPEEVVFAQRSYQLEMEMANCSLGDFCQRQEYKCKAAKNVDEANIWGFLQVLFEANARQALLEHLGFANSDSSDGDAPSLPAPPETSTAGLTNGMSHLSLQDEGMIRRALVVGDYATAVERCFQAGKYADALLLSSCGGAELWASTQQRYFEACEKSRPYLGIVKAVMGNQFEAYIDESEPGRWRETLAVICSYGASQEFGQLCVRLGKKLDAVGDIASASLCYMCSLSLSDTVKFWKTQLENANKVRGGNSLDLNALHEFVVKVHVFYKAASTSHGGEATGAALDDESSALFLRYARELAEQGSLVAAAKYASQAGMSIEAMVLRDSLYRSRSSQACLEALGGVPPEFPYAMVAIDTSRGQYSAEEQRQAYRQQQQQEEAYRQQQESYIQQQNSFAQQQPATASSQQQQQTHEQYQAQQSNAQVPQQPSTDGLPDGWVALYDPNSGMTYYANQKTGESSWERPQAAPLQPQPEPIPAPTAEATGTALRTVTVASKYGDGFVSSASDPRLAHQYGNVGTSNPYTGAARPGTAAAAVGANQTDEQGVSPISGTMNLDSLPLSDDVAMIRDALLNVVETLKASPAMSASDKRQLAEAEKGVAILVKKLARQALDDIMKGNVYNLAMSLVNRDFGTASAIQTALVNSDWRSQKDWLKGIKLLIQLASKKLERPQTTGY